MAPLSYINARQDFSRTSRLKTCPMGRAESDYCLSASASSSIKSIILNYKNIPAFCQDIQKAALVLFRPQADRQKTTIYNYGLPQDSRHFYKMPRDLLLRQSSGCMDGDISVVVARASRRPRTSMRLVKVGNTIVALARPSFHSTTGLS